MEDSTIRPLMLFSVGTKQEGTWTLGDLKTTLEDRVVPWIRGHYRVSTTAGELILVGWGSSAKVVQDLAASRPDFWTKTWIPPADQTKGEQAWDTLAPAYLRAQFGLAAP